jgi:pimeloyl-ACP methyl ester carboxylesterase
MIKRLIAMVVFLHACLPMLAYAEHCRIPDYPHEIECGTLTVKNAITGKVDLIAWRRVEARARYPLPDPVLWIPGGLGLDATDRAPSVINMLSRLNNSRDLIWMDILGSGRSSPLVCAKPVKSSITEKIDIFSNSQVLQSCHDEIASHGGLKQYSYEQLAHHYEQLRQALKLNKVNVIADGVGSNIALAWHTLAPQAMRSMVLDSPPTLDDNPTMQRAKSYARVLGDIHHACQNDVDCQKYHPQSTTYLKIILNKLPQVTTLTNSHTGLKERLEMNEAVFAQLLMNILRSPARAAALPNVLHAASEGDWQPLIGLGALSWAKLNTKFSNGLWLASVCENGWAHPDVQLEGDAQWFYQMQKKRFYALCKGKWGDNTKYALPPTTPILIFSPRADPFAGDEWTNSNNVKVIRVPGASSGVLSLGCARDIAYRFFTEPQMKKHGIEDTCLTNFPLPVVGPVNRFGRVQ